MTSVVEKNTEPSGANKGGKSSLQKALLSALAVFIASVPFFWYLEVHAGVSHKVASNGMTIVGVLVFATALSLPWMNLPGMGGRTRAQKMDGMILVWLFICLAPRFIWELPWLLFLDQIKQGVLDNALWSYFWSPYLAGGDARYLNGDPLVVTLEWIALGVGMFELYAVVMFFRQGKRFTLTQLSFIMAGMIVEVTLPMVYFGTEIANSLDNVSSTTDLIIKFGLLNIFWCTLPLITYAWGARRIARQDYDVTF